MNVKCWFCKELVLLKICKQVKVQRIVKSKVEKMNVWQCMDCEIKQMKAKRSHLRPLLFYCDYNA